MGFIINKKRLLKIPLVMLAAIIPVILLAWKALYPIDLKNGFNRQYTTKSLRLITAIPKEKEVFDICGQSRGYLYFRTMTPGRIIIRDRHLNSKRLLVAPAPQTEKISSAFFCFVDSPQIIILASRIPAVITASPGTTPTINKFPASIFTRAVKIGPDSYVYRGFDRSIKSIDQIFIKGHPSSGQIERENNISERRGDAGVSTDGALHYDKMSGLLVYVPLYSNNFLCMDTNLNLKYRSHTIDTFKTDQITTGASVTQNIASFSNTGPKRLINAASCVEKGKLYNSSNVAADNESRDDFSSNASIDIYDIRTGRYEGSFYVPNYNGEKMRRFKIYDNVLYALYKTNIASYELIKPITAK